MADILGHRKLLPVDDGQEAESLSELYHENTKLHPSLGAAPISVMDLSVEEIEAMACAFKQYPLHPRVYLAKPNSDQSGLTLERALMSRRTIRNYSQAPLTVDQLSKILYLSYGITGENPLPGGGIQKFRAAPSAGALYPAEIYLGISRVTGLESGLYHYNVPDHALELLAAGNFAEQIKDGCCGQGSVIDAPVTVLITGVMHRTKRKYGERGYRYVLLDVGHMAQNLCLAAMDVGVGVMTTCGFFDNLLNQLLRVDGIDETALYVALLGFGRTGTALDRLGSFETNAAWN
jgi:SagB-type dehydrogenase family enzyme